MTWDTICRLPSAVERSATGILPGDAPFTQFGHDGVVKSSAAPLSSRTTVQDELRASLLFVPLTSVMRMNDGNLLPSRPGCDHVRRISMLAPAPSGRGRFACSRASSSNLSRIFPVTGVLRLLLVST